MNHQENYRKSKTHPCFTKGPSPLRLQPLNSHPIYITRDSNTPICHSCSRPIDGNFIKALCQTWHPHHFCCHHCKKPLKDHRFHVHQGQPYCPEDYANLFLHACASCGLPIKDAVLVALGKAWHRQHFVCHQCSVPLSRFGYYEREGFAYCEECFRTIFISKTPSEISGDSFVQIRKHVLRNLSDHLGECNDSSDVPDASGISGLRADILDRALTSSKSTNMDICSTSRI